MCLFVIEKRKKTNLYVFQQELPAPPPLLFRKLSNPDLSPAAGKTKLQRQLSQDDVRARRSSMAGVLTGETPQMTFPSSLYVPLWLKGAFHPFQH